jgi:microcystin-dependent protein
MEPYIGQLSLVPYNFAPQGWALCQGQLLPIVQNTALFSLIGNTYGGDGVTTFALPNLTGDRAMTDANGVALNWIIALVGVYPPRD